MLKRRFYANSHMGPAGSFFMNGLNFYKVADEEFLVSAFSIRSIVSDLLKDTTVLPIECRGKDPHSACLFLLKKCHSQLLAPIFCKQTGKTYCLFVLAAPLDWHRPLTLLPRLTGRMAPDVHQAYSDQSVVQSNTDCTDFILNIIF